MTMNDGQRLRDSSLLAAARNVRSTVVMVGRRWRPPKDGEFVPQHDDFQFLPLVRSQSQAGKLKHPPHDHVAEPNEHVTSCGP